MSESRRCKARVSSDSWHFYQCGNPVKKAFGRKGTNKAVLVCGIHARRYASSPEWVEVKLSEVRS